MSDLVVVKTFGVLTIVFVFQKGLRAKISISKDSSQAFKKVNRWEALERISGNTKMGHVNLIYNFFSLLTVSRGAGISPRAGTHRVKYHMYTNVMMSDLLIRLNLDLT